MRLPIAARCCVHSPQVTYGPTRSVSSGWGTGGTTGLPYFALIHAPTTPAIAETAAPPIVKLTPSTSIQAPYFAMQSVHVSVTVPSVIVQLLPSQVTVAFSTLPPFDM